MKTLYQALSEIGAEMDSHESDLYVRDSEPVRAALRLYNQVRATRFIGNDGDVWWDVPFSFDPWWESRTAELLTAEHIAQNLRREKEAAKKAGAR
jgi:hypothetical protein